ncbi:MAG: S49 family peptidase, partial [Desulfoferrobacter sp.]
MTLKRALVGTLASIGSIVILLAVAAVLGGIFFWPKPEPIPNKIILEIDFEKGFEEYAPTESVANLFSEKELSIKDTVFAIQKAAEDARVLGLVARVGSTPIALATVQEMRDAMLAFRSKKKPAVVYSETFGEFGPGNNAYYLATAFDKVFLQPSGDIGLTGLMYQSPFIKEALEKLGISPKLSRRGEYKTAVNTFTEERYTEAQKESLTAVMDSNFKQIVEGISAARGLSNDKVRKLIDQGPFLSTEALNANLVDDLLYRDEVYDRIQSETDETAKFISIKDYWEHENDQESKGPVVAVIYGVGTIHLGKSKASRIFGGVSMGSDTVTKAFRQAAKDKRVKAILFRIDSPGGSYVASDTIWRQILLIQKAGKPVVASMGDMAASGGYFVAMAANRIVAHPSTLTGSIGVFAGKAVTTDFWNKLGVTWDEVHTSDHSTMWSTTQDYTPQEWDIL